MRTFRSATAGRSPLRSAPTRWVAVGAFLASIWILDLGAALPVGAGPPRPIVIGPVATITEVTSGAALTARVDTGAAVSSLHCSPEDCVIEDPAPDPRGNVGKPVRLRVETRGGQKTWIRTEITDYVEVRNAEAAEHRYRVRLPLKYGPVNKEAIVNLNDRSRMQYRMLLGRDFLAGHFVVDVSRAPSAGADLEGGFSVGGL